MEGSRVRRTVCLDLTGREIASYPDNMKQVQVGADFWIHQQRYIVVDKAVCGDELMIRLETTSKKGSDT